MLPSNFWKKVRHVSAHREPSTRVWFPTETASLIRVPSPKSLRVHFVPFQWIPTPTSAPLRRASPNAHTSVGEEAVTVFRTAEVSPPSEPREEGTFIGCQAAPSQRATRMPPQDRYDPTAQALLGPSAVTSS